MKLRDELEDVYLKSSYMDNINYDEAGDYFEFCYEIGGAQGGNCWGDEPSYYSETVHEFTALHDVVLKAYPNITLQTYLSLYGSMEIDECTNYEYYGNYTVYKRYRIRMDKCMKILKEHGYE